MLLHRVTGTQSAATCAETEVRGILKPPFPGPEDHMEALVNDEEFSAGPNFSTFSEFPEQWACL